MSPRRFVLVVNPLGGRGKGPDVVELVRPLFAEAGCELDVRVTGRPGHAAEIAETIDLVDCDGLCAVGGDGTVHQVASGLMRREEGRRTPLGVIPAGSGNSVLEHLRCQDPQTAVARIISGSTRPLDVMHVKMTGGEAFCVNIAGWGAVVDINVRAERLRSLGPSRYALAALGSILRVRRRRASLVLDDRQIDDEFLFVVACNTKFTGKRMQLAPRAEIDDGKMDVVVVRPTSRRQLIQLFQRVFDGSHVSLACVDCYQVSKLVVTPEQSEGLNLDGELVGSTPFAAEVLPGALRIFA